MDNTPPQMGGATPNGAVLATPNITGLQISADITATAHVAFSGYNRQVKWVFIFWGIFRPV